MRHSDVDADVETWRLETLLAAGYTLDEAEQLAVATYVDLHQAVELVTERHCDTKKATEILL